MNRMRTGVEMDVADPDPEVSRQGPAAALPRGVSAPHPQGSGCLQEAR